MKYFITLSLTLLSVLLLTLATPGYDVWYAAYFALIPLIIALYDTKKGFLTGWLFGFIYFLFNVRWVVTAVSDFGDSNVVVGWLVTMLFAAILGVFWGIFGYIFKKKPGANLLLAGVIVALEVARNKLFSGFPMLNLADTQYCFPPAIQIAEITGAFGISLIIAYINLSVASLLKDRNVRCICVSLLLGLASFSYGYSVLDRSYAGNDMRVEIIQPAYSQADKWVPDKKYDIMALVNGMLRDVDYENTDLILMPETVYPAFLNESFAGYQMLSIAGEIKPVITGGIRFTEKDGHKSFFNSVFMFNKEQVSIYDKIRLVPFGEFFPLQGIFKPIDYYFFKGAENFTSGTSEVVFSANGFNAAPMVCYESMYPDLVRKQVMLGADVITVVTNDSWFGHTKGPYQHLASDVLRAVEFRKPVLRAAQTGISACIGADGEIQETLDTGVKGHLRCDVTTHKGLTLFATGGYGWLAVFLFVAWFVSRRNPAKRNSY